MISGRKLSRYNLKHNFFLITASKITVGSWNSGWGCWVSGKAWNIGESWDLMRRSHVSLADWPPSRHSSHPFHLFLFLFLVFPMLRIKSTVLHSPSLLLWLPLELVYFYHLCKISNITSDSLSKHSCKPYDSLWRGNSLVLQFAHRSVCIWMSRKKKSTYQLNSPSTREAFEKASVSAGGNFKDWAQWAGALRAARKKQRNREREREYVLIELTFTTTALFVGLSVKPSEWLEAEIICTSKSEGETHVVSLAVHHLCSSLHEDATSTPGRSSMQRKNHESEGHSESTHENWSTKVLWRPLNCL